jgi:hypothetical protein
MEQPIGELRLQASTEALILVCSNLSKIDMFLSASEFASKKAVELFEPFALHHMRMISRSLLETKAAKESQKLILFLWDKSHSPTEAAHNYLSAFW